MLTDDSCAVCLEQLSTLQHVAASDCSQPVKADGHKPMICWLCMLEHIKTKSTCPLCRGTLTTVHKFPLQLLDALDANASIEGALESVLVGSLTQPALTLSAVSAIDRRYRRQGYIRHI